MLLLQSPPSFNSGLSPRSATEGINSDLAFYIVATIIIISVILGYLVWKSNRKDN